MKHTWIALLAAFALLAVACQPAVTPAVTPAATPSNPLQLELKGPALGAAVDESPFLEWVGIAGATHYQVTVLDSHATVMLEKDTTNTLLRVIPSLPKGTSYSWNVQAQDASHAVLAELNSRFSVKADLVLVWPPAGEAVDATPELQWQSYSGAVQYQVVIYDLQTNLAQIVVDQTVHDTRYAVAPTLRPGSYRWTVQAQDAHQIALAELMSEFTVKAHLEVLDPVDGGVVGATPMLRWAVFEDIIRYQVIITNSDALPPETVFDREGKGTQMVVDTPLKPETHYALTIRALKDGRKVAAESNSTFTVYATQPLGGCENVNVVSTAECQALVAFYQQTGGPSWANGTNWASNNTPCEWSGVTCTDGHVTDLNLYNNAIQGSLPAALADLTDLRTLALHDNQLTGPIPPELGRLEHLTFLDLAGNALSGSLPAELGQLGGLEMLFLNNNQLSGELPANWAGLTALRHLDLSHNAFTGAIPPELGQLPQLQTLRLGHNQLSGNIPAEIGQLAQLTEVDLSYNQLSGAVPAPILGLPYRALWGNQLEGTLRCDAGPSVTIDYQGVSFSCVPALGASVWPEAMPAVPLQADAPFWKVWSQYLRFTLARAPDATLHTPLGAALSDQAQVLIFPAADYEALDRQIRLKARDLRNLLADRPATIDGDLPLLPLTDAGQLLHARVHYLTFQNGSGVSYLTQYSMGPGAVNNQDIFYTFQGMTDDRAYYVFAFFPVSLPSLPANGKLSEAEFTDLMANFLAYRADTIALLEAQAPEAFTPDLAQIDQFLESLVVR